MSEIEVDFAECECCGLIEECTLPYIQAIRERYGGKWICGLCAEAVKDEVARCEKMLISPEEALARHLTFCNKVRASGQPGEDPTVHLIQALRQVLRKSLGSPRALMRSVPIEREDITLDMKISSDDCISSFTSMYCEME